MEEIARFDLDMDGSMDAFEDGRWVRYDDVQIKIAAIEAERDALRAAVKEARKAALEEALIACNGEALEDPTGSADDIAYDLAVEDCRNAIRAIAAKEPANGQG